MPPPLDALASIAALSDEALTRTVDVDGRGPSVQYVLYDLLRHEQDLAAEAPATKASRTSRILAFAQAAYGELIGVLIGRPDDVLDTARDGEWSLRDLLRHAMAVELRYCAQVEYSASRKDDDPLAIPADRLPGDRLSPPDPEYAETRSADIVRMLELLGQARARSDERLGGVADAALARPSLWGTVELTVRTRLHQVAAHLTEVVVQAEKCLGPDLGASEARRILRHSCYTRGLHERRSAAAARDALDARYRFLAGPLPAAPRSRE